MKLNCTYRGTDGWGLKYSTSNVDIRCDGNPNCAGFAEDFGGDTQVLTKADHIRSMSDQQLSEFLSRPFCDVYRTKTECARFDTYCNACALDWLEQPYEEENT